MSKKNITAVRVIIRESIPEGMKKKITIDTMNVTPGHIIGKLKELLENSSDAFNCPMSLREDLLH